MCSGRTRSSLSSLDAEARPAATPVSHREGHRRIHGADAPGRRRDPRQHGTAGAAGREDLRAPERRVAPGQAADPGAGRRLAGAERQPEQAGLAGGRADRGQSAVDGADVHVSPNQSRAVRRVTPTANRRARPHPRGRSAEPAPLQRVRRAHWLPSGRPELADRDSPAPLRLKTPPAGNEILGE